jgi:hypothetical protein
VLTFFLGQTFAKCSKRHENALEAKGHVAKVASLVAAALPKKHAEIIMRYTNSMPHIYYLSNSGEGMNDEKWDLMKDRGLLTSEEIVELKKQGSPGVVLNAWAVGAVQDGFNESGGNTLASFHILASIGNTRHFSSKQIDYSEYQIPFIYFQTVFFVVNSQLAWQHYESGQDWGQAVNYACDGTSSGSCYGKAIINLWCHLSLVILYLSLLLTAANLAECYGDKQYHYDLGRDLDQVWTESQDLLKSMDHRCVEKKRQ